MHIDHAQAGTLTGLTNSAVTYMYTLSVLPCDVGSAPLYALLTVSQHLKREIYGFITILQAALAASPKPNSFGEKVGLMFVSPALPCMPVVALGCIEQKHSLAPLKAFRPKQPWPFDVFASIKLHTECDIITLSVSMLATNT